METFLPDSIDESRPPEPAALYLSRSRLRYVRIGVLGSSFDSVVLMGYEDWRAGGYDGLPVLDPGETAPVVANCDKMVVLPNGQMGFEVSSIHMYHNVIDGGSRAWYGVEVECDEALMGTYKFGTKVRDFWIMNNTIAGAKGYFYLDDDGVQRHQYGAAIGLGKELEPLGYFENVVIAGNIFIVGDNDVWVTSAFPGHTAETLPLSFGLYFSDDDATGWVNDIVLISNTYQVPVPSAGSLPLLCAWHKVSNYDSVTIHELWNGDAESTWIDSHNVRARPADPTLCIETPDPSAPWVYFLPRDAILDFGVGDPEVASMVSTSFLEDLCHFMTGEPVAFAPDFEYGTGHASTGALCGGRLTTGTLPSVSEAT